MRNHSDELIEELKSVSQRIRLDSLDMVYRRKAGHLGGSFSEAEILAGLYFHHMNVRPSEPDWEGRDRFVLSKGHASAGLYSVLAQRGFFPRDVLATWGDLGSMLQGHPDRVKTPGVDMTSGLLGHGLSVGVGMALGQRMSPSRHRVYVLIGDADAQCGFTWEAALIASKYRTHELTTIMDFNDVTNDGIAHEILSVDPIIDKWQAFGFATIEIDGHDLRQFLDALDSAAAITDQPTVIVSHTIKGKGVSFMEGRAAWHGKVPSAEEYAQARSELLGALQ